MFGQSVQFQDGLIFRTGQDRFGHEDACLIGIDREERGARGLWEWASLVFL